MEVSLNWLKDYVNVPDDIKEFCEAMTMTGTKVEGYSITGSDIEKVVVGKIMSTEPHPDSDHLIICQVDVGKEEKLQIVTGAQNIKAGDVVPVCLDGAKLPGGKTIKNGKLRGVPSQGMLCSLGELGLSVNDFPYAIEDGIFVLQEECNLGDDIKEVCKINDTVVEFELTFNRPDCLSYIGIAREVAATFGTKVNIPQPKVTEIASDKKASDYISVNIHNKELCPRYTARVVKNVKIGPSPLWLRAKLRAAGVRPINNIVDITNFVMLEYGQPMHAFDYEYIKSREINVRNANEGETIVTLDGVERNLTSDMLVIADGSRAVALAGVMGGENSEITENTTTVVFESANFARENIRKTSKSVGLRTDSSAKFEKGLPACNTLPAVDRAAELVTLLGCGEIVEGIIDVNYADISQRTVAYNPEKINALLGTDISNEEMDKILASVELIADGKGGLSVPPYRSDIINTADIAEEVVRLYGFDNIEPTMFRGAADLGGRTPHEAFRYRINDAMAGLGYCECCTYSFVSPNAVDKINLPEDSDLRDYIRLINPLGEDTSVMRTHPLPSMLEVLSRNVNRKVEKCRMSEIMTIYRRNGDLSDETKTLCFAFTPDCGGFYDIKADAEALFIRLNICARNYVAVSDDPSFHPGRCADIFVGETVVGRIGEIHPLVCENFDLPRGVCAAMVYTEALLGSVKTERSYIPLPVYPAMERDIALICDKNHEAAKLLADIRSYANKSLESASVFDVYSGKGVEEGKKSVAVRLVFRLADKTMTDEDADAGVNKILKKLEKEQGIVLRS
ncbi:MAG: phenylalanine--tRNA ligase subunit beta [Ruminococcaceae bacterium]|nr:phenylalanine--tRNA ligase subunit beta [Oscillospiraceae bacterium]